MPQYLGRLALVLLGGGCSIVYNTGNIPPISQDATIVDQPFDANASMLSIDGVAPAVIFEGQGDGGSRPAILVIHGANFVVGAQVVLTASSGVQLVPDNTQVRIATTSDLLAVPVSAPVDLANGSDKQIAVTVQVTQPVAGGGTATQQLDGKLTWQGLDELDAAPANTDASKLAPLYSRVQIGNPTALAWTGGTANASVLIRAVSSITIGPVTAKGASASGTTGGAGGPGACAGASAGGDATCDGGGHKGNTPGLVGGQGGDGGGAGFSMMGAAGTSGSGPGAGGLATGDDLISTYSSSGGAGRINRASGGGGGGANGLSLGTGGAGGGGGGTLELTAGGDLTASTIDVTGGAGSTTSGGGGGGGGAGGVIMVRAGGTLATGTLTATGGAGGGTAGHGADGRIRWDAPGSTMPVATPAAVRGPAFVAETPQVFTGTTTVTLVGSPGHTFNVRVVDDQGADHAGPQGVGFSATDGKASFVAPLERGYNQLCVTLPLGQPMTAEAEKCIAVAYLP